MHQYSMEAKNLTDVDLAYYLLKQSGKPQYYKELIIDVLTSKGQISAADNVQVSLLSGIYTQITLDSRFIHLGKGVWGLGEWYPKRGSAHVLDVLTDNVKADSLRRGRMLLAEIQDVYTNDEHSDEFEKKFDETD